MFIFLVLKDVVLVISTHVILEAISRPFLFLIVIIFYLILLCSYLLYLERGPPGHLAGDLPLVDFLDCTHDEVASLIAATELTSWAPKSPPSCQLLNITTRGRGRSEIDCLSIGEYLPLLAHPLSILS